MIRWAVAVVAAVLVVQGCQTGPSPQAAAPVQEILTVHVTADQQFVCEGKTLSVEEFFEQADYAEGSNNVPLDADQKSAIAEATIVKAIEFLKGKGYVVAMSNGSKYQHLIP